MLKNTNIFIKSLIKIDRRFCSLIKKYKEPIVSQDERLINKTDAPIINESVSNKRKALSYFDHYSHKSLEKLDLDDSRLGPVILNARSSNNETNNLIVVEGINMIRDAIKLNAEMTHLFCTKRDLLKEIPLKKPSESVLAYYISYKCMKKFSNLSTPPGIMAIFKRPDPNRYLVDPFLNRKLPLTLILDNIRDPGNLGTIIRTAAAFNIDKVFLTKGCISLYNDKVLRSSMASIFCVPVFSNMSWDEIRQSLSTDNVVYFADILNKLSEDVSFNYSHESIICFNGRNSYSLVIGGEIDGISEDAKSLSADTHGCKLHIPIINRINSLNSAVSAAIIMSEFHRKFSLNK